MKAILITSVAGMIFAGIYGVVDFAGDYRKGTLIRYNDGTEQPVSKKEVTVPKIVQVSSLAGTLPEKKENAAATTKTQPPAPEIKMEYFSRGEPPVVMDLPEQTQLDSTGEAVPQTATARPDSVPPETIQKPAVKFKVKTDSAAVKTVEKPSIGLRSFSRAPLRLVERETTVAKTDSLKK